MKKLALLMAILMMVCASASAVTASDENVYPIADEVVTLTVWTGNVANRDYVNCDMTKFIEEKLGVKINFQFYTDDANTAYNLMLASDEWPDIFLGPWFSTDKILMGMEAKMLLPLNDLIETQGYNYKAVLEANPGYKDMLTAPDGNIYTFVYTDSGVHKDSEYKMFVKQSWLEKLGMEMPTTPEEFKDLLIAIKETDLNENGENDEIPLMGYYNGRKSDPICFLMNPFELYTDNYYTITDDGQIAFHANTDGWREGLKYIADLYANGLIAEETYVQDKTQFQAILNKPSDDAVIGVMPIWYQGDVIDANVLNWVDYEPIAPLKGDDGTQQSAARFGGNFNMVGAISTKCETPKSPLSSSTGSSARKAPMSATTAWKARTGSGLTPRASSAATSPSPASCPTSKRCGTPAPSRAPIRPRSATPPPWIPRRSTPTTPTRWCMPRRPTSPTT